MSLFMPMNFQNHFLMLQYEVQLIRCEPTTHFNVAGTYCTGNGVVHDGNDRFHLEPWTDAEWIGFRDNFTGIVALLGREIRAHARSGVVSQSRRAACRRGGHHLTICRSKWWTRPRVRTIDITSSSRAKRVSARSPGRVIGSACSRTAILPMTGTRAERALVLGPANRRPRHSVSYLQCTVLHEFGHTLGLDHINGPGNDDWNYGVSLDQREDLMGMGDHLTARDAHP